MIDGLKPYPEYKESDLTWLDRIPAEWNEQRSKYLFREVDRRSSSGEEIRLSMSQRLGLIPTADVETKRLVSETNIGGKICEPGDLVLNRLKAHLGVFAVAPQRGLVSPDYTVLRSIGSANGRYFCTLYRSPYCGQELRRTAKGIVEGFWRLYTDQFYDIRVPVPPPDEQAAIVRFLDHANRKIDGFVRAKRKLIGLLNEQKQAIIHRAVTRGLNPDVPLKPSGIPWLGDIPAHWGTITVGASSRLIQTGPFGSQLHSNEYVRDGTPLINPSHMKDGAIDPDLDVCVCDDKSRELARHRMQVGDIIAARRGELGRCALVTKTEEGWLCGTGSLLIRIKPDVFNPGYFQEVFSSSGVCDLLRLASVGATMDNLNAGMVGRLRFPLPSVEDQTEILNFIRVERTKSRSAISTTEREIALMQEYRTRLTADIVTGKLDVREAAAKLPDLPAEAAAESSADDEMDDTETEELEA